MSYPHLKFLDTDPSTGAEWTRTLDGTCECVCPAPMVEPIEFSFRTRVFDSDTGSSGSFGEWSNYGVGNTNVASNSDPDNGGAETQVRCRITVTGNGRPAVVRYRQIDHEDTGSGPTEHTVFTPGDIQTFDVPAEGGSVEFTFVPCAVGHEATLSGRPGGGVIGGVELVGLLRRAAYLRKRGWRQYTGDSPAVKVFRQELVNSGGDPGCAPSGRPARFYSGHQLFEEVAGAFSNNWVTDPVGHYVSTLSANLVSDHHASTQVGVAGATVDFGKVTHPSETSKLMVEEYKCGGATNTKSLELLLTSEYPTDDLKAAVSAVLADQATNDANITPPDPRVVHREWLSPCEVHHHRVKTVTLAGGVGPADGVLGGPGYTVVMAMTCEIVTRDLISGGVSESSLSLSYKVQANGDLLVPGPRGTVAPDFPIDPIDAPWDALQTEVLIRKVTVKPNSYLSCTTLICEDQDLVDLGVD